MTDPLDPLAPRRAPSRRERFGPWFCPSPSCRRLRAPGSISTAKRKWPKQWHSAHLMPLFPLGGCDGRQGADRDRGEELCGLGMSGRLRAIPRLHFIFDVLINISGGYNIIFAFLI